MTKWGSRVIFFPPDITWYSETGEPIESREKHYSLMLYILSSDAQVIPNSFQGIRHGAKEPSEFDPLQTHLERYTVQRLPSC